MVWGGCGNICEVKTLVYAVWRKEAENKVSVVRDELV
jgi:hypothetical protein